MTISAQRLQRNVFPSYCKYSIMLASKIKARASDRLTDRPTYRVAFPRLKMELDLDPFPPAFIDSFFIHLTLTFFDVIDWIRFNNDSLDESMIINARDNEERERSLF